MSSLSRLKIGAVGFSLAAFGAIACGVSSPVRAQSTTVDPLEDFRSADDSSNPFEASGGNAQNSIFEMIHQMQLRNGGSLEDFNRQRNEDIQTQAETFRTRQRQQIDLGGESEVLPVEEATDSDL
ncbi:MAG: hypothetical protein WBA57_17140 [Elainellaceae cyanobacterium]